MFIGRHFHSLDAKGRVAIPHKLRGDLGGAGGGRVIVTVSPSDRFTYLDVYPAEEWEATIRKIFGPERVPAVRDLPRSRRARSGAGAVEAFRFRTERYEYVEDIPAFDLLTGSPMARELIEAGDPVDAWVDGMGRVDPGWDDVVREAEELVRRSF